MPRLSPALRPLWPLAKRGYTRGTRLVAPLAIRASARRGGWLPTHGAATLDDAAAATGGTVTLVRPPERLERPLPEGRPRVDAVFAPQQVITVPRQAVAELPAGRVLGPQRAVVAADGGLVEEVARYFGTETWREHPVLLHPGVPAPLEVDGRLAVLASRGDMTYYHFLFDVLPRLETLRRSGVPVDRYYVPAATRFQQDLLTLLGIPADAVVDAAAEPHVRASTLVVPTLPDLDLSAPTWVVPALRERLLPPDVALVPGRRIYVTRGTARHTRIVRNEGEVLAALAPAGFTVVDPGTLAVADQIRAFAEAELIVAPHGAALTNLAFASPGATVVEIFPPRYVQGCYWKLADTVPGLRYRYLVGHGRVRTAQRAMSPAADIVVDTAALAALVDELAAAPEATR
ncbi:MAG: glycosyltransferase family 61 protein [Jatrophihabitans sp.]|uniref:glycosyltransferase family 61 protein n=1 Tax=Jatrophihabitans sp. TaxID=1932789 RepID=UPI003F7F9B16